jgi:hypothetical protein
LDFDFHDCFDFVSHAQAREGAARKKRLILAGASVPPPFRAEIRRARTGGPSGRARCSIDRTAECPKRRSKSGSKGRSKNDAQGFPAVSETPILSAARSSSPGASQRRPNPLWMASGNPSHGSTQ